MNIKLDSSVRRCALSAFLLATLACSSRPDRSGQTQVTPGTGATGSGATGSGATGSGGMGSGGMGSGGMSSGGMSSGGMGTGGSPPVMQDDATCMAYTPPKVSKLSPVDPSVAPLVNDMTQDEKIGIMSGGPVGPWDFEGTGVSRLGIEEFQMRDGPRGVHAHNGEQATTFAVAEARAASFDVDMEYRIGEVIGTEMIAYKWDLALSPTINVLRHPGWARAQETYGEDPVLVGRMGVAFTNGVQEHVPACPKHYAGNNTDENRTTMIATVDEKTLRENYTRAFKMIVDEADPACIMAAYNGVNGDFCAENEHLMTEIVRNEWGWTGFMLSDWWATKGNGVKSVNAGLDLEMPDNAAFEDLPASVGSEVETARLDEAATRIINARVKFGQMTDEYKNSQANPNIHTTQAHKDLALESALKGAVLLKNDNILPLGAAATTVGTGLADVTSIIVMGPDADKPVMDANTGAHGMGDRGSSNVNPPYAISYLDGITARATGVTVTSSNNPADAAGKSVVIIPVTMGHEDEGEAFGGGGDRDNLWIGVSHPFHWETKPTAFINQVAAVNPNVIVLLAVGSAVLIEDFGASAKGIVQTFYPGQEAGNAVAKLLFGDVNFSAKLPFTVATDPAHYPEFGNLGTSATYEYLHGYRRFEANGTPPRFWFGFGMSYTSYTYSDFKVLCSQGISQTGRLNVEVTVTNSGAMAGDEVVQLYIKYPAGVNAPPKELKAFTRVSLAPGESKPVQLSVAAVDMAHWGDNGWEIATGEHTALIGPSADPAALLAAPFTIN